MVKMLDVNIGLKRSSNIHLAIVEKVLMLTRDVDIGIIPATLSTITHMTVVVCCVYMFLIFMSMKAFMAMKEVIVVVMMEDVDIGIPTTTQMDVVYFGSIIFFPSCLRRFK